MVDFAYADDHEALAAVVRELLEKACAPDRLRERWEAGRGHDPDLWQRLADVGVLGLAVPAEHGGTGPDPLGVTRVLEEAGYAAAPGPLLETVAVVAPALVDDDGGAGGVWLAPIASGGVVATAVLDGVPYALDADAARVIVAERDGVLAVLEPDQVRLRRVDGEDRLRSLFAVELEARGVTLRSSPERARQRGALGAASMLVGVGRRLLDDGVAYASTRHQFGQPIGSFQAVSHALASVAVDLAGAEAAVRYAAYAEAHDLPDRAMAISAAKVAAGDAEASANTVALQVHGGIGFTWEHDLHIWLKRGRALEQAYGSAREHRARVAEQFLDGR